MWIAGLLTAFAIIILLLKMKKKYIRRILGYDVALDIAVTGFMALIFYGTYSGMMAAIIGGLVFSIAVHLIKMFVGSETLSFNNRQISWAEAA